MIRFPRLPVKILMIKLFYLYIYKVLLVLTMNCGLPFLIKPGVMKQKILSALLFLLSLTTNLNAQTIWNGPLMTFTKAAFANHTLAANQDRITASTWITRAGIRGIFNIFSETSYIDDISPS